MTKRPNTNDLDTKRLTRRDEAVRTLFLRLLGSDSVREKISQDLFELAAKDSGAVQEFIQLVDRIYATVGRAVQLVPSQTRARFFKDIWDEVNALTPPFGNLPVALGAALTSHFDRQLVTPQMVANFLDGQRTALIAAVQSVSIRSSIVTQSESGPRPERHQRIILLEEVSEELLQLLLRHPDAIHELTSYKFEAFVAELLRHEGFDTQVTPRTRDGGIDIYATKEAPEGSILLVAECKKWNPDRPVDVSVVRQLYGVVELHKATAGLVATTSRFTKDARRLEQKLRYRMALRDYQQMYEWLARVCRRGWEHDGRKS